MHASFYINGITASDSTNSAKAVLEAEADIRRLVKKIDELTASNQTLTNENELLKSAVPVDVAPLDDNERIEYETKIRELNDTIATLTEENQQLRDAANQCTTDNAFDDAERNAYEEKITRLTTEIHNLTNKNEELKEALASQESKINQVVQPHIDAYTKLTQRCNDLENTINQNNVNYYKDKVEELNAKIKDLSSELLVANTTVTETNNQLSVYKEENDNLKATIGAKTFEIEELNKRINANTTNEDEDIKNSALYHMLQEIRSDIASSTAEVKTLLTEEEASEIMEFVMHLHDTYFEDIPFSSEQFKQFVWNVPRRFYEAMIDSLERYEPDILNPVTVLYLAFTDEPGWVCGHFLLKLEEMIDHDRDAIDSDDEDYVESLNDDEDTIQIDKKEDNK